MPGRDDFAIIRAHLLTDCRAHRAAVAYVDAGVAVDGTSLATVVGHVAILGLWASRETDDGVLPDDGSLVLRMSAGCPADTAKLCIGALLGAGLLRTADAGTYVVGFRDCYLQLLTRRRHDAERKARDRAEQAPKPPRTAAPKTRRRKRPEDVLGHRTESVPDRTGQVRTDSVPLAVAGGVGGATGGAAPSPSPCGHGSGAAPPPVSPGETATANGGREGIGNAPPNRGPRTQGFEAEAVKSILERLNQASAPPINGTPRQAPPNVSPTLPIPPEEFERRRAAVLAAQAALDEPVRTPKDETP